MEHCLGRREALLAAAGALPLLQGCVANGDAGGVTGRGRAALPQDGVALPADLSPNSVGFMPQFFMAESNRRARKQELVEVAFSLHCGESRDWFRKNGRTLARDIASGRTVAFLSHLVRSENELPAGVEMMAAGQQRYREMALSAVALSLKLDRPLGAADIRALREALGIPAAQPMLDAQDAEARLLMVAMAYHEGLGVTGTPYVSRSRFPRA